jgi:predicted HAD superfamily Cof-like phosphohydrolase
MNHKDPGKSNALGRPQKLDQAANGLLYDRTSISAALIGQQELDLLCDVLYFLYLLFIATSTSNISLSHPLEGISTK